MIELASLAYYALALQYVYRYVQYWFPAVRRSLLMRLAREQWSSLVAQMHTVFLCSFYLVALSKRWGVGRDSTSPLANSYWSCTTWSGETGSHEAIPLGLSLADCIWSILNATQLIPSNGREFSVFCVSCLSTFNSSASAK